MAGTKKKAPMTPGRAAAGSVAARGAGGEGAPSSRAVRAMKLRAMKLRAMILRATNLCAMKFRAMNLVLHSRDAFAQKGATEDLAARSVRGGAVSFAGQGVQFAFQIAAILILARLLTPSDFGLVAMVAVIVAFGTLLRDAGLSSAVVQSRTITRSQCAALFTLNVMASVVLGVVICASGPAIAHFYHREEVLWITIGLGVPLIIEGLATQHLALLRRNMMHSTLVIIQVGFQAAYFVGAVGAAAAGAGYWALVIGHALGVVVVVSLTFFFCRWLPERPRPGTEVGELLRFGTHMLGPNVVNYVSGNAATILVGRYLGAGPLGLYSRAFSFFALPINQIREPIQRVWLPTLRLLVDDPKGFRRYFLELVNIVATLSFPLGIVCVISGGFFVRVLLGPQWLGAVPVFRIFGAVMLISPVVATLGLVQLSAGRSRRYLQWNAVTAVVFVASFVAGLHWGIEGVAMAYATANFALLVPAARYGLAQSSVTVDDFLGTMMVPAATSAVAGAVALGIWAAAGRGLGGEGLAMVGFVVVYAGLSLARRSVRDLLHLLRGFGPGGEAPARSHAPVTEA
jgi:O-antigen/teichoic acid export membrane protein